MTGIVRDRKLLATVAFVSLVLAGLWTTSVASPPPTDASGASEEWFIKFQGIDGEALHQEHEGWSEIESFDQKILRPESGGRGKGEGSGIVVFEPLLVTKELDKASPKLAETMATGRVFPEVRIDLVRTGGGADLTYYAFVLNDVQILSYETSGNHSARPTDEISLTFEEFKAVYRAQDETGAASEVEFSWDVEENKKR